MALGERLAVDRGFQSPLQFRLPPFIRLYWGQLGDFGLQLDHRDVDVVPFRNALRCLMMEHPSGLIADVSRSQLRYESGPQ